MRKKFKFIVLMLIIVDIGIKYIIINFFPDSIDVCKKIFWYFHLHPIYNINGNGVSAFFSVGYNDLIFLILSILGLVLMIFIVWAVEYEIKYKNINEISLFFAYLLFGFVFIRFLRVIMGLYTLDYIEIKGLAIFDLSDIYFFIGSIGLIYTTCLLNKKVSNEKKNKMKIFSIDKDYYKNIYQYIKNEKFKR